MGNDVVERRVVANGLLHRVLEWNGGERVVVLLHGFMDAAGSWDEVASRLGARVIAPDMRGFGDGARVPRGGYYHFPEYVFDVADLLDELAPLAKVSLVGHSMGGTVATLLAGAFPERVERLVTLEGLGPPDSAVTDSPARMRRWIEEVRGVRATDAAPRTFDLETGLTSLARRHPAIPRAVLAKRLPDLVERSGDGWAWRYDPLHRTTSPVPFFASVFRSFAAKVTCPVLYVSGGSSGFHPPDEEERIAAFADVRRAEIADAGHMMHWTRPAEVAARVREFLGE